MDNSDKLFNSGPPAWDANQRLPTLRPPRQSESTTPTTTPCNATSSSGDLGPVLKPHMLSAEAKEFVPKSIQSCVSAKDFVPRNSESYQPPKPTQKGSMQNRLMRIQNGSDASEETTNTCTQNNYEDPSNSSSFAVRRLNEFMQEIIVKPGRFDALARMLVDESVSWFGDNQVAAAVVDAIVSQAIIERNFQYNGARLCSLLSSELDILESPVFSNHLFDRVKQEYAKVLPDAEKQPSKVFGFVGFLAELYSQMGKKDSTHCLGEYFLDFAERLVSVPTADSVKRVCQLLKLTGGMLDKENKAKMDSVIAKLMEAGYKTNTTPVVGSVISLREQNWGLEVGGEEEEAVIDTSLSGQPCLQSEAIQYGPDGLALSKEESDFLHDPSNVPDDLPDVEEGDDFGDEYAPFEEDEMDEEMQQGFLQFLIESKQL